MSRDCQPNALSKERIIKRQRMQKTKKQKGRHKRKQRMSQRDRDIEKGALSVLHRQVTRVTAEFGYLMTGDFLGGGGGAV